MLKNAKHEHFAQCMAKGVTATEAAVTAGFSVKRASVTGSELLARPDVTVRITELKSLVTERVTEKIALDKAWVVHQLMENVKMAKQAEPVKDAEGNPTGEYRQNLAAANKALELLGKELGMFVDRSEVRTGPLEDMQHDDLKALDAAIAAIERARGSDTAGAQGTAG